MKTFSSQCIFVLLLYASSVLSQDVTWYSIDAGGGISSAADISLIGVIGQAETARLSVGDLSLSGGYLPLPPDTNTLFENGFE